MGIETKRYLALHGPLGDDELLLRHIEGSEALGACFEYTLTLYSLNREIEAEAVLGKRATARLKFGEQPERFCDGIVCEFAHAGYAGRYTVYRMVLRPELWLLSRNRDCRVYQRRTVPEILYEVFQRNQLSDIESMLTGSYAAREYCVQYRESDLHFVQRLMQEEGIYYAFQHKQGAHTLLLLDASSAHQPVAGLETLSLRKAKQDMPKAETPMLQSWMSVKRLHANKVALNAYDFGKPRADLLVEISDAQAERVHHEAELYDYPDDYTLHADGDAYARLRLDELLSTYETAEGRTNAVGLHAGALLTLEDAPRKVDNREYVILSLNFGADSGPFESGGGGDPHFAAHIRAMDSKLQFRPARNSKRQLIAGAQTATVVGPQGREIWTDEFGRVKVQFHWDRYGKHDEDSSCWIRVAQSWAGSGWGGQFIPRIGQEVVVEFLDGSPDRPLITGCVYNGNHRPPFELPEKEKQSGIRSDTVDASDNAAYNELRFDDSRGHEELYLQAQRNLTVRAKHDSTTRIGHDATLSVKNNVAVAVAEGNHDTTISKGAMRVQVKEGLYGATAKEIVFSADDAIVLRVADTSIRLDATGLSLTVGSTSTINIDSANLLVVGPMVNINPPSPLPIQPAEVPPSLTNMGQPAGDDEGG